MIPPGTPETIENQKKTHTIPPLKTHTTIMIYDGFWDDVCSAAQRRDFGLDAPFGLALILYLLVFMIMDAILIYRA